MSEQTTTSEPDPSDAGSRIDPVLARSWLLVNGAQYERFAPAAHSRADIVVLDIEDAVAPKDKAAARGNVISGSAPATAIGSAPTASERSGGPMTSKCWPAPRSVA